jgi:hypothetical protein
MPAPQIEVLNGPNIDAGSAESNVIGLEGRFIVGLITPLDWDSAVATIMISGEGDNYYDLFDARGNEFVFNITPGVMIYVDHEIFLMAKYIRLRSGTRAKPVEQSAVRRFSLVVSGTVSSTAIEDPIP